MLSGKAKGIVAIVVSAFGFSLMALFVRLCDDCGGPVSAFQKGFFRNVVAFAIAAIVFWRSGGRGATVPSLTCPPGAGTSRPRRVWALLLLRATLGTAGIFAHFYALGKITIAEGLTLNKTAPFFTVLFAWLFLGERASRRQWLALAAAFGYDLYMLSYAQLCRPALPGAC